MKLEEIRENLSHKYEVTCKCGKKHFVLTQDNDFPEYHTEVYSPCECGEYVEFDLPVNQMKKDNLAHKDIITHRRAQQFYEENKDREPREIISWCVNRIFELEEWIDRLSDEVHGYEDQMTEEEYYYRPAKYEGRIAIDAELSEEAKEYHKNFRIHIGLPKGIYALYNEELRAENKLRMKYLEKLEEQEE